MQENQTAFDLNNIADGIKPKCLAFTDGSGHIYLAFPDGLNAGDKAACKATIERRFPQLSVDSFMGANINDGSTYRTIKFWSVYIADCAFPPMFLVAGSDDLGEIIDIAVDTWSTLQITQDDLKTQYDLKTDADIDKASEEGTISMSGDGHWYDGQINAFELTLLDIII